MLSWKHFEWNILHFAAVMFIAWAILMMAGHTLNGFNFTSLISQIFGSTCYTIDQAVVQDMPNGSTLSAVLIRNRENFENSLSYVTLQFDMYDGGKWVDTQSISINIDLFNQQKTVPFQIFSDSFFDSYFCHLIE